MSCRFKRNQVMTSFIRKLPIILELIIIIINLLLALLLLSCLILLGSYIQKQSKTPRNSEKLNLQLRHILKLTILLWDCDFFVAFFQTIDGEIFFILCRVFYKLIMQHNKHNNLVIAIVINDSIRTGLLAGLETRSIQNETLPLSRRKISCDSY